MEGSATFIKKFYTDLLVLGKRAGEYAARFAKEKKEGAIDEEQVKSSGLGLAFF